MFSKKKNWLRFIFWGLAVTAIIVIFWIFHADIIWWFKNDPFLSRSIACLITGAVLIFLFWNGARKNKRQPGSNLPIQNRKKFAWVSFPATMVYLGVLLILSAAPLFAWIFGFVKQAATYSWLYTGAVIAGAVLLLVVWRFDLGKKFLWVLPVLGITVVCIQNRNDVREFFSEFFSSEEQQSIAQSQSTSAPPVDIQDIASVQKPTATEPPPPTQDAPDIKAETVPFNYDSIRYIIEQESQKTLDSIIAVIQKQKTDRATDGRKSAGSKGYRNPISDKEKERKSLEHFALLKAMDERDEKQ